MYAIPNKDVRLFIQRPQAPCAAFLPFLVRKNFAYMRAPVALLANKSLYDRQRAITQRFVFPPCVEIDLDMPPNSWFKRDGVQPVPPPSGNNAKNCNRYKCPRCSTHFRIREFNKHFCVI